jgi:ABC-type Fe3+ transport system permease subunit
MIVALLVSVSINVLVVEHVLSRPYVSLGLLIAAIGAGIWQYKLQAGRRKVASKKDPAPEEAPKEGKLGTIVWYILLLLWAASLVYALFRK